MYQNSGEFSAGRAQPNECVASPMVISVYVPDAGKQVATMCTDFTSIYVGPDRDPSACPK
jgi:hypothetical protein